MSTYFFSTFKNCFHSCGVRCKCSYNNSLLNIFHYSKHTFPYIFFRLPMEDGTLEIHEESSGGKKNMSTRTTMKEISTDVLLSRTYDVSTGRTLRVETTTWANFWSNFYFLLSFFFVFFNVFFKMCLTFMANYYYCTVSDYWTKERQRPEQEWRKCLATMVSHVWVLWKAGLTWTVKLYKVVLQTIKCPISICKQQTTNNKQQTTSQYYPCTSLMYYWSTVLYTKTLWNFMREWGGGGGESRGYIYVIPGIYSWYYIV